RTPDAGAGDGGRGAPARPRAPPEPGGRRLPGAPGSASPEARGDVRAQAGEPPRGGAPGRGGAAGAAPAAPGARGDARQDHPAPHARADRAVRLHPRGEGYGGCSGTRPVRPYSFTNLSSVMRIPTLLLLCAAVLGAPAVTAQDLTVERDGTEITITRPDGTVERFTVDEAAPLRVRVVDGPLLVARVAVPIRRL